MSSGEPASTAPPASVPDPELPKFELPTATTAAKDAKSELTEAGPAVDHSSTAAAAAAAAPTVTGETESTQALAEPTASSVSAPPPVETAEPAYDEYIRPHV
jgi:hypothetical protein